MQVVMQVDGVKSKTLRTVLIIVLISIHSIGLFSFNQTCEADGPPTLYVGSIILVRDTESWFTTESTLKT
jgi:hypothetical protein